MPTFIPAALKLTTSLMTQQTFLQLGQHNFRLAIHFLINYPVFLELPGQHVDANWVMW